MVVEPFEIIGYVKCGIADDWQKIIEPIPMPTDNHEII